MFKAGDVRLMCSYGGHQGLYAFSLKMYYHGGRTKILYVERNISFSTLLNKLFELDRKAPVTEFKYELPDCDIPITVDNKNDLESMMREYDRLRVSMDTKTAPLIRIFV